MSVQEFDLDTQYKITVMQAYLNGESIEAKTSTNPTWKDAHFDTLEPRWCWGRTEYRIKHKFEVGDYVKVVYGTGHFFTVSERCGDGRYLLSNGVTFKASELQLCFDHKPLFKSGDVVRIKSTGNIVVINELYKQVEGMPFYTVKEFEKESYSEDEFELFKGDYCVIEPYSNTNEFFEAQEKHGYYIQFSDTVFNIPISVIELDGKIIVDCITPAYKHLSGQELTKYKWKDGTPCGKKVKITNYNDIRRFS